METISAHSFKIYSRRIYKSWNSRTRFCATDVSSFSFKFETQFLRTSFFIAPPRCVLPKTKIRAQFFNFVRIFSSQFPFNHEKNDTESLAIFNSAGEFFMRYFIFLDENSKPNKKKKKHLMRHKSGHEKLRTASAKVFQASLCSSQQRSNNKVRKPLRTSGKINAALLTVSRETLAFNKKDRSGASLFA